MECGDASAHASCHTLCVLTELENGVRDLSEQNDAKKTACRKESQPSDDNFRLSLQCTVSELGICGQE